MKKFSFILFWVLTSSTTVASVPTSETPSNDTDVPTSLSEFQTIVRTPKQMDGLDVQRKANRLSPGFTTGIELGHEPTARFSDALNEVLVRSSGTVVRSIGGLGQFSSVSFRGSTGQQVAIFIDGVPLPESAGTLISLGDLPLDATQQIEIYRGYIPIAFGSSAIGGVLNLVGKPYNGPARLILKSGWGSYSTHEWQSRFDQPWGKHHSLRMNIGYASSKGNFSYYNNNGTPLYLEDDRSSQRKNNDYQRLFGQVRMDGRYSKWRYSTLYYFFNKQQSIPGNAHHLVLNAFLNSLNLKNIGHVKRKNLFGPGGHATFAWGIGLQQFLFQDPHNEIGLGINQEHTQNTDIYLAPLVRIPLPAETFVNISINSVYEWNRVKQPQSALTSSSQKPRTRYRLTYAGGLEIEQYFWQHSLQIVPALRYTFSDSHWNEKRSPIVRVPKQNIKHQAVSPRIGARWQVLPFLQIRTSAGQYFRSPSLIELFGDQGFMVGNVELLPERGTNMDIGVVIDTHLSRFLLLYLQSAIFRSQARNLIHWQQSGSVVRPFNVKGALNQGLECSLVLNAWERRYELQFNYTFLDSQNQSEKSHEKNKALVGQPRHHLFSQASVGSSWASSLEIRMFANSEHIESSYLDPSGRYGVPKRTLVGAGFELKWKQTARLVLEIKNLFNLRKMFWTPKVGNASQVLMPVSDYIGYPLAGRSIWLTLTIELPFDSCSSETT